jgi:dolichyl-phosphate beta-glucosyltransferase
MLQSHSIIIPAYNEAQRLGATLETIVAYAKRDARDASALEVIVVCDGCSDATTHVAGAFEGRLPLRVLSYPVNRGKGYAVRQGMAASTGQVVAFMDADGSTPVSELTRLSAPILREEADIVIGSRRVKGAAVAVNQSLSRQLLGRAFALHAQVVLGLRVQDTQCGFKVFRGPVARDLFASLRCDGFAFDLEVLAAARERRLRVQERGVEWHERSGSTVQPLRDGLRMLRAAWQIRAGQRTARHTLACAAGVRQTPRSADPFCEGYRI